MTFPCSLGNAANNDCFWWRGQLRQLRMCRCFDTELYFQCFITRGFCSLLLIYQYQKGNQKVWWQLLWGAGKPMSCQLPRKSTDGASLAVPELSRTLGNILTMLCQTEPCRVATVLLDLNLDEDKFQQFSVWGSLSLQIDFCELQRFILVEHESPIK